MGGAGIVDNLKDQPGDHDIGRRDPVYVPAFELGEEVTHTPVRSLAGQNNTPAGTPIRPLFLGTGIGNRP